MSTGAPSSSDSDPLPLTDPEPTLFDYLVHFYQQKKKNPSLWCCLVYCLMYSSLLILQTRCFFFQWKVLTGEIFKVVLKANKPFFKECHCVFMCCWFGVLPPVGKRKRWQPNVSILSFVFLTVSCIRSYCGVKTTYDKLPNSKIICC